MGNQEGWMWVFFFAMTGIVSCCAVILWLLIFVIQHVRWSW
jgi:hypothetical protein